MNRLVYTPARGLLCNRVGSPNAQIQTHRAGNTAPVTRGIWVFPWPYNDYFFSYHQAEKRKPKSAEYVSDELWKRLKRNEMKTKRVYWNKPFYSHLKPDSGLPAARWYLWQDHRAFVTKVNQNLFMWSPQGRFRYSIDHLEMFLPMTAGALPFLIY